MDHKAHVRLVDAHAKCDGGHNDLCEKKSEEQSGCQGSRERGSKGASLALLQLYKPHQTHLHASCTPLALYCLPLLSRQCSMVVPAGHNEQQKMKFCMPLLMLVLIR